jgi:hypothetical protein
MMTEAEVLMTEAELLITEARDYSIWRDLELLMTRALFIDECFLPEETSAKCKIICHKGSKVVF